MATKVDICNLALSVLGDTATVSSIDPPEGSAQADHCARFYGQTVNEVLSRHSWSFALKRARLSNLVAAVEGDDSARQYALPSDCLRVVRLYSAKLGDKYCQYDSEMFFGQRVIVTDVEEPWIIYVSSQVDETAFPPLFTTCVVHRLASWLAGPLITSSSGTEIALKQYELYSLFLARAIHADAVQQHKKEKVKSRFLEDYDGVMPDEFY